MGLARMALVATLLPASFAAGAASAAEYPLVVVGAGALGFHGTPTMAEAELQLRGTPLVWRLAPQGGLMVDERGGVYGWVGLAVEIPLGEHLVLTPAIGPGYYHQGGGIDLGYPLEFRSQIELAWRFDNDVRLGLEAYHISNAGLGDRNPGVEAVVLTVAIPLK
jgi:lipid A 3-O-deacylase